jgi:hypothetical protein
MIFWKIKAIPPIWVVHVVDYPTPGCDFGKSQCDGSSHF